MQIIRMERDDAQLFCLVTGQPVYDDEGEPVAPSFRGFWHEEFIEEPTIADGDLEDAWAAYLERVENEVDDDSDVETFLTGIDRPGWIAIRLTIHGFACGPVSETFWTVLDLEHEPGAGAIGNLRDATSWDTEPRQTA